MEILVVAATEMEILPYLKEFVSSDILITGVGSPACMYSLTKKLQLRKYDMVLQAGIAGTFKAQYALGETVIVKQDVFADLGISETGSFFTLFERGYADANSLPYTKGMLQNSFINNFSLPVVNAITVNTVTDEISHTERFVQKYDPDIETMEGAAFHYVCISEEVPFIQIRSISNRVGDRIKANWKMKESIECLNENLVRIVQQLQNQKA